MNKTDYNLANKKWMKIIFLSVRPEVLGMWHGKEVDLDDAVNIISRCHV